MKATKQDVEELRRRAEAAGLFGHGRKTSNATYGGPLPKPIALPQNEQARSEALKAFIEKHGLTHKETGKLYGVSFMTIGNWLQPERRRARRRVYRQSDAGRAAKRRQRKRPKAVIAKRLRGRFDNVMKGRRSEASVLDFVGCTLDELKAHIEGQFEPGMTWGNRDKWHIDHIMPLSAFNLDDPEDVAAAWHFSNLRPLWAEDNIKKSDEIVF